MYMGDCENYGAFLGALNSRCRIIIGIQKWTIILTTTHVYYVRFRAVPSNGEPHGKESGAQNGNCTAIISSTIELRAQG